MSQNYLVKDILSLHLVTRCVRNELFCVNSKEKTRRRRSEFSYTPYDPTMPLVGLLTREIGTCSHENLLMNVCHSSIYNCST